MQQLVSSKLKKKIGIKRDSEHAGLFICEARNSLGIAKVNITVDIPKGIKHQLSSYLHSASLKFF